MSSIQNVSSQSSIFTNNRVGQSAQPSCPPKPPGEDRQGKDGGGLLGALDSALKSAGITDGLASIFGSSQAESTTNSNEDTTNDTSETASASDAFNAFIQQLMSQLQSSSTSEASDSQENSTSLQTKAGVDQRPPPPPPGMGYEDALSYKLNSLIASLSDIDSASTVDMQTSSSESDGVALQSSFNSLLTALGANTENGSDQLQQFLSSLVSQIDQQHGRGQLVSTSA